MKISARPLKGEPFDLEVNPEDTIAVVKDKIAAKKAELSPSLQKVVYAGKVLSDSSTVAENQMKEGDFVVVMLSKAKPAAAAAAATAAVEVPTAPAASAPVAPADVPMAPSAGAAATAAAAPLVGVSEATIEQICSIGFPRPEVEKCLRAAFGNPDRAVEYLMSGIPPGLLQRQEAAGGTGGGQGMAAPGAPPAQGNPTHAVAPAPSAPPAAGGGAPFRGSMDAAAPTTPSGPLAPLMKHPRFHQLKMVVQNMPQSLNQVLAAIDQTDPSLVPLIAEHQEEFISLMQEAPTPPILAMLAAAQAAQQQQGSGGGAAGTPANVPSAVVPPPAPVPAAAPQQPVVQLTAAEQEAIGRLQALGFDRRAAAEAYLACERNEELAANYLFDAMED